MNDISTKINERLDEIEYKHNVKILYACESGSRAWGFHSVDSDYDVRFIYAHQPDWYLSIYDGRDVIEYPVQDNLDINGWDIKKTLGLLYKSNPPLLEWLKSPIIYRENDKIFTRLVDASLKFYSLPSCYYHYFHMANGNYRQYLQGETVWIKKYFYVLRPILAIKWIEDYSEVPPIKFETLLYDLDNNVVIYEIENLLKEKLSGKELGYGNRNKVIGDFLDAEIERMSKIKFSGNSKHLIEPLNKLFRDIIKEV